MYTSNTRLRENNRGGGKSILIIDVDQIVEFPEVVDNQLLTDILVDSDAELFEIVFTLDTFGFNETEIRKQGSLNGFQQRLAGVVPKDRLEILQLFDKMARRRFVVIYTDENLNRHVIGSKETPAKFNFNRNHGTDIADRNQYNALFVANSKEPSPSVPDNIDFEPTDILFVYQNDEHMLTQKDDLKIAQFM